MAVKLGSADVSFRLGATTPAAVYLGAVQAWAAATVPAKPAFNLADLGEGAYAAVIAIPDDGGSPITEYRAYVNGVKVNAGDFDNLPNQLYLGGLASLGDTVRVSVVNAIGESPLSDPLTVE